MSKLKTCSKCGESKALSEFKKRKDAPDGHEGRCRVCANSVKRIWNAANNEKLQRSSKDSRAKTRQAWDRADTIVCNRCGQEKPKDQYYPGKWICKECNRAWRVGQWKHEIKLAEKGRRKKGMKPQARMPGCSACPTCSMPDRFKTSKQCATWQWMFFLKNIASETWITAYKEGRRKEAVSRTVKKQYEMYWNDPKYRLNRRMKNMIGKNLNGTKNGQHWQELVGWTIEELMRHLKKLFKKGMTFDNYGEWHIDHKIPLAAFNFTKATDLDFRRAWALSNLQPMWGAENISKGDRLERPFQPCLSI